MTYHQTKRTGKPHTTKEVSTLAEIFDVPARTEFMSFYRVTEAYIRDFDGDGWFEAGQYKQILLLSCQIDLAISPVVVWETAVLQEGLSTYSDIGDSPVWYSWKLRWCNFPSLHLEGHRIA